MAHVVNSELIIVVGSAPDSKVSLLEECNTLRGEPSRAAIKFICYIHQQHRYIIHVASCCIMVCNV